MDEETGLIAGRFEVHGDRAQVLDTRRMLGRPPYTPPGLRWAPDLAPIDGLAWLEARVWLRGVDRTSGAPVLISPRDALHTRTWTRDVRVRMIARQVKALGLPCSVPVLHAGPEVVFADPGPLAPRPALPLADAADCALELCEATARLHEAGCTSAAGDLCFDPMHLRVRRERERWQIQWLIPGVPSVELYWQAGWMMHEALGRHGVMHGPLAERAVARMDFFSELDPGAFDVWSIVDFFFTLCPPALDAMVAGGLDPARAATLGTLQRIHAGDPEARPGDVASLARLLLSLSPARPEREARIAALPAITAPGPLPHDWDAIIADGEALLLIRSRRDVGHVARPLAAAYHQRASRSFARGALDDALPDAVRAVALDPHFHYRTTRAVILDALGRREESRREIHLAVIDATARAEEHEEQVNACLEELRRSSRAPEQIASIEARLRGDRDFSDLEVARAHAVRGMFALRDGAPATAERYLRGALELAPTALAAHALGAARYALGDLDGAAQAEARSIELDPARARYRWALVITLRKLGRRAEAREQAMRILERWPDAQEHREQFIRLFGE